MNLLNKIYFSCGFKSAILIANHIVDGSVDGSGKLCGVQCNVLAKTKNWACLIKRMVI